MPDLRVQDNEPMRGANHPTDADTINRLPLAEHNNDGTHRTTNIYNDLVTKRPVVDVRAFGATGDGATDDTSALQDAINYAATNGLNVYAPEGHYMFTRLYFHYHATYNPGWPTTSGYEGKIAFVGDGAISSYNLANSVFKRTVLESTDSTGPALFLDGTNGGNRLSNILIGGMTVIANNSTWVIQMDHVNHFANLEDIWVYQKGSGGGVLGESTWVLSWRDVYIYGGGTSVSSIGLVLRTLSGQLGGGNMNLHNVNTYAFDKGWEIGHNTYGSGAGIYTVNCYGCQASTHKTYGVMLGHGIKNFNWYGGYIEAVQDGANGGIGALVKNRAQLIGFKGAWFSNNDIGLQIGTSDADANVSGADIVTAERCNFNNILVDGIKVYGGTYSIGKEIDSCKFVKSASAPGSTTGINVVDVKQIGLAIRGANEFDTALTTAISNKHRVNILEVYDPTHGLSLVKSGDIIAFTANDTTPSVAKGRNFETANTGATTITALDDGFKGQEVTIIFNDANTTVDFTGTTLKGNAGADFTASAGDSMKCLFDGTNWICAV